MFWLDILLNVLFALFFFAAIFSYGKVRYYQGRMDENRATLEWLESLKAATEKAK